MPRQLEIRTTILAKRSRSSSRGRDANEDFAAEALQLLDEIQQLKANLIKTDKKVLGTYKKSPPKPKRHEKLSTAKKDVYNVVYPAAAVRDEAVISRCLNPGITYETTFTPAPVLDVPRGRARHRPVPPAVVEHPTPSNEEQRTSSASSELPVSESRSERKSQTNDHVATTETCVEAERLAALEDVNSADELGENTSHASMERHPTDTEDAQAALPIETAIEESNALVEESALPEVEVPVPHHEEEVDEIPVVPELAEEKIEEERKENQQPRQQQEKSKFYDRKEIRKYMQKQKKERKEKSIDRQYVCHHKRPSPLTRAEIGLPANVSLPQRPKTSPLKKSNKAPDSNVVRNRAQEDWGPYEQPNFMETFSIPVALHETDDEKSRKKKRPSEKSVQTDRVVADKVDEATQMTAREEKLNESATNWLYSLPSSQKATGRSPSENPRTVLSTNVSSNIDSSSSDRQILTSSSSVSVPQGPVPAPVGHLIAQIENLEHYLGNLLESAVPAPAPVPVPSFNPYNIERPPAVPAKPPPSAYYRPEVQSGTFTLPDGRLPLRASIPHSIPPEKAQIKQKTKPKLDETSTSTQYRPLPDHLDEYVRLTHRVGKFSSTPLTEAKAVKERKHHNDWSCIFPNAAQVQSKDQQAQQQTYFRDFNEILRTDPALTEKSNSWKRVATRKADEAEQADRGTQPNTSDSDFQSHSSDVSSRSEKSRSLEARRQVLVALTDELKETLNKIPQRSTRHESGFQSKLSELTDSTLETSVPKNGPGSRTGARDSASRTTKSSDRSASSSRRTVILPEEVNDPLQPLDETTFMTLTPQTTSFEASAVERKAPFDSTGDADKIHAEQQNSSIFSTTFSPIPRAVSPLSLISEQSIELERKQSTSSSDRSEHDRSIGEKLFDNQRKSPQIDQVASAIKKSDDLLTRLRSELMRDESLFRSLQHVDRLEQQRNLKIQLDPATRSFFETQSDALKLLMQQIQSGTSPSGNAFHVGSQAAVQVDRMQKSYSSDFEPPSSGHQTSPEVPTEESIIQPTKNSSAVDVESDSGPMPPKAVDMLLQEEAKQQRILLKLREKARIEKTLAELSLLQVQKRILRAQGDREKAASIKKKQRGLLMKLQEERANFESMRRKRKKEVRNKSNEHHSSATTYDTSSWETDVSVNSAQQDRENFESDSSTSTLQPVSEEIKVNEAPFEAKEEANESTSLNTSNPRLRAPLSPRTTESTIRERIKLRRRHSSGSDDSINLSQAETTSDVSDVESRLLALTDQLQKRQAEAQRLKLERKRINKEKLIAQESALLKQIEVYDKCITDLRTQLDGEVDQDATTENSQLAVRPVIRQPRALIRAEEAKSPTSARSESDSKADLDVSKCSEVEEAPKADSATSSVVTDIRTDASLQDVSQPAEEFVDDAIVPVDVDLERSVSESVAEEHPALSDSGRADETMIIKNDSIVHEELAEEIAKAILELLVEETIDVATKCWLEKRKRQSTNVLQRVSALLSTSNNSDKDNRSQLYLTTTFDVLSPNDAESPEQNKTFTLNVQTAHCDVNSAEGRTALENKLNELRLENEWIDDDLVASPLCSLEINREQVIQEAEELEREQKRIEEEIQRLSAESVLYMREIPNKPPPPYTPPGQAAVNLQRLKTQPVTEVQRIAPKSKDDMLFYCRRFAQFLADNNLDMTFPDELYAVNYNIPEQPAELQVNCRAFMMFLGDLTRHIVRDLSKRASFLHSYIPNKGRPIKSREELLDCVEEAVLIQVNQRPRLKREGQLTKWSQRKRDRIDEILVKELQAEEKMWIDFSQEEDLVKRQTADHILDTLLNETAMLVKRISMPS